MTARDADLGPDAFADVPDPLPSGGIAPAPPPAAAPTEAALTRPERATRHLAGLALAVVWLAAVLVKVGLRPDLGTPRVAVEILVWVATAGLALVLALHPGPRGLSLGVTRLAVVLGAVPAIFVACAVVLAAAGPPLTWGTARACIALSTGLSSLPLAIVLFLFRRSFPSAAAWRLALLGAASGLAGSIGCHAHCPVGDAVSHVVLAHGAPILLGAVLGAIFGAWRGRA